MEFFNRRLQPQGSAHVTQRVVGLRQWSIEPGHDGIAEEFVHRPFLDQDRFSPGSQVLVQHGDEFFLFG